MRTLLITALVFFGFVFLNNCTPAFDPQGVVIACADEAVIEFVAE
jgi:hypothetical protein